MKRRFAEVSNTLSELITLFPSDHLGDLLDMTAGALASLARAGQLKYKDRIHKELSEKYYRKLSQLVKQMNSGASPDDGPWLAGYYFNSALFGWVLREKSRATC